jgi:hypothetical protein
MSEQQSEEISTRINRQGAMLDELKRLAPLLDPLNVRQSLRRLVVEEDLFRKSSLASREQLFSNLGIRYFRRDTPQANANLVRAARRATDEAEIGLLAYVMLLWNDGLVYLLTKEWFAPRVRIPTAGFRTDDVMWELDRLAASTPEIGRWSQVTRRSVASHYLAMLRDCGLARGTQKKELLSPYIPARVVHLATLLLTNAGVPSRAVAEAEFFRAMGLTTGDVVELLNELDRVGVIDFAVQGDVTHLVVREVVA